MWSNVEGDIDAVDSILRITKVRITYHLKCSEDKMDTVKRAYEHHPKKCPAYMTFRDVIDFTLNLETEFV